MEQGRYYAKKLMRIANISLIFMSAVIIVASPWIINIYHLSTEAAVLARRVLCYHAAMAVVFWIPSFSLPNVFRAAGDVMIPMVIAIASMWIFRLVLSYVLGTMLKMGLMGIWIAMSVDWIFRAICYLLRFGGKRWEP